MIVAVVLLSILCAALLLRVYALERNLRQGAKQLRERREAATATPLRLAAPNAAAEALLSEVNGLLRDMESERTDFAGRERSLRQQISNVSHDLRTPLTSILGYLQLLEREELGAEERREYLGIVERRAQALQGLIVSFYDLSRIEGGEYPLARERVDLYAVLSELLAAFYADLAAAGFDVAVELEEGLPPIWGDGGAVTRVYTNLLRNALDHGEGTLDIKLFRAEDALVTTFTNGAGELTGEDADRVFERFYTSNKARDRQNTGLGLAIVKALTEQMGGRAAARLEGERFTVQLTWKI